jgi:AraC family transcriptional regulator
MDVGCRTIVLEGVRLSAGNSAAASHREHEHPEAQVTVRFQTRGACTQVIPCCAPHTGGGASDTTSVVFHFAPLELAMAGEEIGGRSAVELRKSEGSDPVIVHLAEAALEEMTAGVPDSLLLNGIAHRVVGRLVREYANLPQGKAWARGLTARQLARLREFLEVRMHEGGTVREMAAVVGLGPQRFTALLKASTGITPHAYVTQTRLLRAARLLKHGRPLAEIALACGFAGQSHFGAVFRRQVGVTPREYRRRLTVSIG